MPEEMHGPAAKPCPTCPYRKDVPSGVWHADEYAKLPPYDQPTMEQPPGVFLCHLETGQVCAGWAGCHDSEELLALRLAAFRGVSEEVIEAILDYESPVPLFATGAEAALHGLSEYEHPSEEVRALQRKFIKRGKS